MKNFLSLLFINYKEIFKRQKVLYIIFAVFLIASVFFIFFVENAFINLFDSANSYKNYFMITTDNFYQNEQNFKTFIEDNKNEIDNVVIKYKGDNNYEIINSYYYYFQKQDVLLSAPKGRTFTDKELKEGAKVVIVPEYNEIKDKNKNLNADDYEIGDTYTIMGQNYTIIGYSFSSAFYIPYSSQITENNIDWLSINLKKKLSDTSLNKLTEELSAKIDCNFMAYPEPIDTKKNNALTILIIVVLSIGILNMIFLYNYILEQRSDSISLYRIYGFSNSKVISYLFVELILFIFACILSGIVLYLLVEIGFTDSVLYYKNNLKAENFIFTSLAFIFLYALSYMPKIKTFIEETPINIMIEGRE